MGASKDAFIQQRDEEANGSPDIPQKSKTLYEINHDYLSKIQALEEKDFVLDPEDEEFLTINKSQLEQKAISYLEVIQSKELYNSRIDDEIKRLQALKKKTTKTIDRLNDTLLTAVKTFGVFTVGFTKFGTRKSTSVIVDELKINQLDAEYKTVKVTESANRDAIKKALQAGKEIDGCEIQENLNLKIN
jgi:hypothetical protein